MAMKKGCAWLLAVLLGMMAIMPCLAGAEEMEIVGEEAVEAEQPRIPEGAEILDHLKVGNPTPLRGNFFTNMWGNATSDIDVRELLHGYDLVVWNGEEGMFMHNPSVVSGMTGMQDAEGNHQFLMTLESDLYYSDGTQITAWDYAFSWLLSVAPEIMELGGVPHEKNYLLGYEAYMDGTERGLRGVRVLGDNALMITIDHAYLPYFFELGLLDCRPYPISVIAPGVVVRDDGNGVYLANADETVKEPVFNAELLRETILNPETGYASHPSVVSGPYVLTAWDGETAEFEINPYYKGNENGVLPVIEKLSYRTADNAAMIDELIAGEFDLLNKVTRQDNIQRGMELIGAGASGMSNYPRVGLSYISFACERAAVREQEVRQAIAWCVDRDEVTREYTGNYGIRVDGFYGIGQWMYGVISGSITPEQQGTETIKAVMPEMWEELNLDTLTAYTLDTEQAVRLLEKAGWTLNADGIREKEIDGEKVTLDLKMIYPQGNIINEIFEKTLVPNLEAVGIRLAMEAVPMSELLGRWYGQEERDADLVYLATDFDLLFDPAAQFVDDGNGEKSWYYTQGADGELYRLAEDMDRTEPGDIYGYMEKWIRFQERFNEILPMLPFYSNVYFDFYTKNLHDYAITEKVTWSQAIVEAAMYIAPEIEETDEGEEYGETEDEVTEDEEGIEIFD